MTWVLTVIILTLGQPNAYRLDTYDTMMECFDAREILVEQLGRPIVNYQAVCVIDGGEEWDT